MSRRKLLLADDSITIQKVVNLTFADEGIDVISVSDGAAALAQLASETPDILLADVNMPGPTGYEICERLRANEATRNVPVILLVGSFEPFDETEAARVGANAYLTKPFQSIKQLIAQVNELMETSRQTPAEDEALPEANESEAVTIESSTEQLYAGESTASAPAEPAPAAPESPAPRQFDDLGYETQQPASEAPQQAAQPRDDIDSLYTQSISAGPDAALSDVGIDDEMIETSYSAPESTEEIGSFAQEPTVEEAPVEETAAPAADAPPTESVPEQPLASTETEVGFRSGYDQRFPEDPSKFENTISYENWQPADMREEESATTTVNPLETAPLNETGPQPVEAAPPRVGDDTIRMENRFDTSGSSSFKFDDTDLLDLSPSVEQPVEITSPVNALEQGSTKQLVTLSPELIEMIAQRVVEKLSEKY